MDKMRMHKEHKHEGLRVNGFGAGISRVTQRGGHTAEDKGQGGKMGSKGCSEKNWAVGNSLVPRRA